jgi:hypothetical protein
MVSALSSERVLKKLVEQMNTALPSKRVWLSELTAMGDPSYRGRDGNDYVIDREELLLIKEALGSSGLNDVKIPILLFSDRSQEQSAWRVEGLEECTVISHVLGKAGQPIRDPVFLYLPHMAIIRRKLPTTTVGVFV